VREVRQVFMYHYSPLQSSWVARYSAPDPNDESRRTVA